MFRAFSVNHESVTRKIDLGTEPDAFSGVYFSTHIWNLCVSLHCPSFHTSSPGLCPGFFSGGMAQCPTTA